MKTTLTSLLAGAAGLAASTLGAPLTASPAQAFNLFDFFKSEPEVEVSGRIPRAGARADLRVAQKRAQEFYARVGCTLGDAVYFRAFKAEQKVEMWVRCNGASNYKRVTTWKFTHNSGDLGPKRKQGDRQIPEGLYTVSVLNPHSSFHLSMNIGYPNAFDAAHGTGRLGGDTMLHGPYGTRGCIPIAIEHVEVAFAAAAAAKANRNPVYFDVFPFEMTPWNVSRYSAQSRYQQHAGFWKMLQDADQPFQQSNIRTHITASARGYTAGGIERVMVASVRVTPEKAPVVRDAPTAAPLPAKPSETKPDQTPPPARGREAVHFQEANARYETPRYVDVPHPPIRPRELTRAPQITILKTVNITATTHFKIGDYTLTENQRNTLIAVPPLQDYLANPTGATSRFLKKPYTMPSLKFIR